MRRGWRRPGRRWPPTSRQMLCILPVRFVAHVFSTIVHPRIAAHLQLLCHVPSTRRALGGHRSFDRRHVAPARVLTGLETTWRPPWKRCCSQGGVSALGWAIAQPVTGTAQYGAVFQHRQRFKRWISILGPQCGQQVNIWPRVTWTARRDQGGRACLMFTSATHGCVSSKAFVLPGSASLPCQPGATQRQARSTTERRARKAPHLVLAATMPLPPCTQGRRWQGACKGRSGGAAAAGAAQEGAVWRAVHARQREDQRHSAHRLLQHFCGLHPHLLPVPDARVPLGHRRKQPVRWGAVVAWRSLLALHAGAHTAVGRQRCAPGCAQRHGDAQQHNSTALFTSPSTRLAIGCSRSSSTSSSTCR